MTRRRRRSLQDDRLAARQTHPGQHNPSAPEVCALDPGVAVEPDLGGPQEQDVVGDRPSSSAGQGGGETDDCVRDRLRDVDTPQEHITVFTSYEYKFVCISIKNQDLYKFLYPFKTENGERFTITIK